MMIPTDVLSHDSRDISDVEIESLLAQICGNLKVVICFTRPVEQSNVLSRGIFGISVIKKGSYQTE